LTSTLRGVQPIAAIDGVALAACPGPLTKEVAGWYLSLLETTSEP
jgi:branched-subunit amino acid aminotransferase/4-amino-4-deoxychorismate lyase